MTELISWSTIGNLTPHALWMGAVVLILTGKLVPKYFYDVLKDQKTYWRDAAEDLRETNHVQAKTIEKQEIASDTIIKVMNSVQEASRREGGDRL